MRLKYYPYTIKLKEEFAISVSSRTTTPAIMVEIEHKGFTGYGEASLPPYLSEDQRSVIRFLEKVDFSSIKNSSDLDSILNYIDNLSDGDNAAKAASDIALHDLFGKMNNISLSEFLNIQTKKDINSSYTIGITNKERLESKIADASDYKYLKIKLGTKSDKEIVSTIKELTDKPLFVDVNQGWRDKNFALEMLNWLAEKNVILVEQPLPKEMMQETKWLKERSSLPIVADEAIQNLNDLDSIKDCYSGINVKLMKVGGIRHAIKMIEEAKKINLKIMLGCMTETSCAITAASHLAALADWVDLDGAELISNDLFVGMKIINGKVNTPQIHGIGVEKIAI